MSPPQSGIPETSAGSDDICGDQSRQLDEGIETKVSYRDAAPFVSEHDGRVRFPWSLETRSNPEDFARVFR
jgi:hypothetical protein